jgi:hypothetical protein
MTRLTRFLLEDGTPLLTPAHRATHTYVVGQPGTGKSRALESWALQDIAAGQGVAVIDPHGDLFHNLLYRLADDPEIGKRVIIIDPCERKWVTSFNPLEAIQGLPQERAALFLTDVAVKIWKLDSVSAPRLVWLLTNTFLALSNLQLTLLDLPRFLLDTPYRESLLPRLTHVGAHAYFAFEFPTSQAAIHQWVTPVLNKLEGLIFDPDIRLMLAGPATINFRKVLDQQLVLLVHLPKGIIGEGPSALLGAFIVAHLQKAALSRANARVREPYYLYLDEFQNYTTDNIEDILSESRKYGLSLTIAHQYLEQLSTDLRSAVLNTAGTIVCFRVGYHDALQLAKEIFPSPDYLKTKQLRLRRFLHWPLMTLEEHERGVGWEGLAWRLANLHPREFWTHQRGRSAPVQLRTFTVQDPVITRDLMQRVYKLRAISGTAYGRSKQEVAREVSASQARVFTNAYGNKNNQTHSEGISDVGAIPMWGD